MSVSGTPVTTYYDGFQKAHPSLPPSPRRSGRGVVQRRTRVESRRSRPTSRQRVVGRLGARHRFRPHPRASPPRVLDPTVSTAERAGGVGGALGNPSSYGGTGVPATDRGGGGPTSPTGFPKPPPPPPPRGAGGPGAPPVCTRDPPGFPAGGGGPINACTRGPKTPG